MRLEIPEFCLVVLVGWPGSGKSAFARAHFKPTEVVSLEWGQDLIDERESGRDARGDACDVVRFIAEKRLKRRRITVIDAANVTRRERAGLLNLAKRYHAEAVAIVFDPGEAAWQRRIAARADRLTLSIEGGKRAEALKRVIRGLEREGFRNVIELGPDCGPDAVEIVRQRLRTDARHEHGPFDIIGDVHGCADELEVLLAKLGYSVEWNRADETRPVHVVVPHGRRAVFVGDIVDRGPRSPDVLRIIMAMVRDGAGLAVPGNHDIKFLRWLNGRDVKLTHGLDRTVAQMEREPPALRAQVRDFIDALVSHRWLDGGQLVVAHAGIKSEMIGRSSGAVREFCLYGETSGEKDEFGLPVRYHWAAEYRGATAVVYGHTPVPEAQWLNNTLCIDTGCCFGGKLTALRWPEKEIVSVPAAKVYCEPVRPFGHPPVRPSVIAAPSSVTA